jgi:hypothetical protein
MRNVSADPIAGPPITSFHGALRLSSGGGTTFTKFDDATERKAMAPSFNDTTWKKF